MPTIGRFPLCALEHLLFIEKNLGEEKKNSFNRQTRQFVCDERNVGMETDLKNKLEYKLTRPIRCSGTVPFTGAEEDTAATSREPAGGQEGHG